MIKINLVPDEELSNPLWWVPEVVAGVLVGIIAFGAVSYNLSQIKDQIDRTSAKATQVEAQIHDLDKDVQTATEIKKNKDELNHKREALQSITQSKIRRYRPIIVLEHLQNLKPDGLWFDAITIDWVAEKTAPVAPGANPKADPPKDPNAKDVNAKVANTKDLEPTLPIETVMVEGRAFDNILVAEFMSALKSTQTQEPSVSDLRTQVALENVELDKTESVVETATHAWDESTASTDMLSRFPTGNIIKFKVMMTIRDHELKPANNSLIVSFLENSSSRPAVKAK